MEEIKGVVLGFCAASLVLGAVYMLRAEKTATEKSVRFAFAIIFLCITVLSVAKITGVKINTKQVFNNKEYMSGYAELYSSSAKLVAEAALFDSGIDFEKISVLADKSESGSIFIKRVTVQSPQNPEKIKACILSVIETNEVEVINERPLS